MLVVSHSACLMFRGSFEPAYILNITATESHCQRATNARNSAVIQSFLFEVLGVPEDHGIVRFQPIKDDWLATGGRTLGSEIERAESENVPSIKRALTHALRNSIVPRSDKSTQSTAGGAEKARSQSKPEKRGWFMAMGWRGGEKDAKQSLKPAFSDISVPQHSHANDSPRLQNKQTADEQ
jgi:hypothetical protein